MPISIHPYVASGFLIRAREFARERATQRQPTHKRGEHSADRERRRAKHQPQHSRPKHFVNKPGRAGQNETQSDQQDR